METDDRPFKNGRAYMVAIAVLIGLFTVIFIHGARVIILRVPLDLYDEAPILLFQVAWVSIPFILLSMLEIHSRVAWATGILLTGLVWGSYLLDGISRDGSGSGANIGLGLLLLVSPLVISISCAIVARQSSL